MAKRINSKHRYSIDHTFDNDKDLVTKKYVDGISVDSNTVGFINRTDSTLSYNLSTRTFTITGTFSYYCKGVKITKTTANESVQHGTSIGKYFVYYNGSTLTVGAVDVAWDFKDHASIALIYYNGTAADVSWTGAKAFMLEERHGIVMDSSTHANLHFNTGTIVKGSGFSLNGTYVVASGTGGLADVTYGVDSGTIMDEDLESVISSLSDNNGSGNQYPTFYRVGAGTEWRWYVNNVPYLFNTGTNNSIYNQLTGGSYQLTEILSNNTYFNMYLCAIPFHSSSDSISYRFVWVMGQNTYITLGTAQAESILDLNTSGLPFSEVAPLKQITLRYASTYSTASGKTRIEAVKTIVGTKLSITATYNAQSHNNLSNRSDSDSHPATAISTDITNFTGTGNKDLTSSETNVQLALEKIDNNKLSLKGGTINGPLTLPNDPTNALHAAPKQYVDSAVAAVSNKVTSYTQNIGNGSSTSIVVTHSLGTRDVSLVMYRNSSPYDEVGVSYERTSENSVTLNFVTAPTTNQYRVLIVSSGMFSSEDNYKNHLVDGGFNVSQTVATTTTVTNPSNGTYPVCDMWKDYAVASVLPTRVHSQQYVTPGELDGPHYFYRINCNGNGTSPSYGVMETFIENGARNLCGVNKQVTVSFWARSSISGKKVGIYLAQYYGTGGSPSSGETITGTNFTLTSTWTKYSYTFTTNTLVGKTFGTNQDDYLRLSMVYAWGSGSSFDTSVGAGGTTEYFGNGDIDLAMCKLNTGSIPTTFTAEDRKDVTGRIIRYLCPLVNVTRICEYDANRLFCGFPINMRATPTLLDKSSTYGTDWGVFSLSGSSITGFTPNFHSNTTKYNILFYANKTSHGLSDGQIILNAPSGIPKIFADARF